MTGKINLGPFTPELSGTDPGPSPHIKSQMQHRQLLQQQASDHLSRRINQSSSADSEAVWVKTQSRLGTSTCWECSRSLVKFTSIAS